MTSDLSSIDCTLCLPAFEPAFIKQLSEFCPTVFNVRGQQVDRPMAQANLKHGFSVCGIRHEPQRVQFIFSKPLR